ncbi:MFS transporter [Catenulispora pinistramenti]|uniref:MFS transporter n=1 Tax=Catenulispora pinistramenti TaxID=2705254 RepID=UPI002E796E68|nr:MFS transporter [Catenulispora pinistramenti]
MAPTRRLWLAVLSGYLALGATLQELPPFLSAKFHVGPAMIGLVVGAAFAAAAAGRPFAGRWGDAGRSRAVVVVGGLLAAVAGVGTLFAPDIAVLLLCRLVMGAGEAALFSGALPWVLADTPPDQRGRVAGWFGLSMWGGLTLGPVLAAAVAGAAGSTAVWWTVAALPLLSAALVVTAQKPTFVAGTENPGPLLPPGVTLPGSIIGLAAYGYGTLAALLVLSLGHSAGRVVALPVFACAFLVVRGFGSPLVDGHGGAAVARVTLVVQAAGLALLAAAPDLAVTLVGAAITGAGLGLIYPATAAMTLHRARTESGGAAVGAMTSFWDIGILIAGPVGGSIAAGIGYHAAFAAAAVVTVVALVLAVRASRAVSSAASAAGAGAAAVSR